MMARYQLISSLQALLLVLLLGQAGCGLTHLHNKGDAERAEKTHASLRAFRETGGPYDIMLSNLRNLRAEESKQRDERVKRMVQQLAVAAPGLHWSTLQTDLRAHSQEIARRNQVLAEAIARVRRGAGEEKVNADDITKKRNAIEDDIKGAIAAQNQWQARRLLLQGTITFVAENHSKKLSQEELSAAKKQILDQVFDCASSADVDSGPTVDKPAQCKVGDNLVQDRISPAILTEIGMANFDPRTEPGIKLVMLGLARDLTDAELQRSKARLR